MIDTDQPWPEFSQNLQAAFVCYQLSPQGAKCQKILISGIISPRQVVNRREISFNNVSIMRSWMTTFQSQNPKQTLNVVLFSVLGQRVNAGLALSYYFTSISVSCVTTRAAIVVAVTGDPDNRWGGTSASRRTWLIFTKVPVDVVRPGAAMIKYVIQHKLSDIRYHFPLPNFP